MDKLDKILLWFIIPILIVLGICGTAVIVALSLKLLFNISVPGLA